MPLTEAQLAELRESVGAHLESEETIAAAADGLSASGWAALLRGGLWIVGLVVSWFFFPRWTLVVTSRRILAVRKHPFLPRRFTDEVLSYAPQELETLSCQDGSLSLCGPATGGEEVRYGSLSAWKPSRDEFEDVVGRLRPG